MGEEAETEAKKIKVKILNTHDRHFLTPKPGVWMCPNKNCSYTKKLFEGGKCPKCGTQAKEFLFSNGSIENLIASKQETGLKQVKAFEKAMQELADVMEAKVKKFKKMDEKKSEKK